MSITRNRVLLTAMLLALPLICFSQQPEQIVKQYVSLLDNFLMSPNSSSKRMAFENAAFLQGCYFKDDIYIKYKNDSRIEDCMAKDYAGLLSNAINANRSKSYANVKIARDLSKSNNGGINEVTAYLQYSGAIEMRTVTVFHVKDGKIIGLTNDFIKTKEWNAGDNHHDPLVVIDQNLPIVNNDNNSGNSRLTFTISGVSFDMIKVSGGTFQMGSNDSEAYDYEKPVHSVTLSDYYIGETEVTQGLWKAVMGSNPSYYNKYGDNYPVERVSWNDCQEFIRKLNQKTGRTFRLPTEAEWEYAARGGNKSRNYKYSGSNNLSEVAWYGYFDKSDKNRTITIVGKTMPIKTKSSNELGLYDMSGNVMEWCNDYWEGSYSSSSQTNPIGAASGAYRVIRGGNYDWDARSCRSTYRNCFEPDDSNSIIGLRLAISGDTPDPPKPSVPERQQSGGSGSIVTASSIISFTVNGVSFNMIRVQGGTFSMGAQKDNKNGKNYDFYANDDEKPVHSVTLYDYYIGETEVSCGLWKAVMGSDPSFRKKGDNYPVRDVSWDDCQEFIKKLNQLIGKNFRLPTEAEWEYAARGGNKSRGYKYSGSNNIKKVAWYDGNGALLHPVKSKSPNELGLYDMSGNVWEWCKDCYGVYSGYSETNPQGVSSGGLRVCRGGSWLYSYIECRSSNRDRHAPVYKSFDVGLRLALVP